MAHNYPLLQQQQHRHQQQKQEHKRCAHLDQHLRQQELLRQQVADQQSYSYHSRSHSNYHPSSLLHSPLRVSPPPPRGSLGYIRGSEGLNAPDSGPIFEDFACPESSVGLWGGRGTRHKVDLELKARSRAVSRSPTRDTAELVGMGSTAGLTTTLTAVSASTPTAVSGENAAFVVTTEPSMPTEVVELTEAAAATVISPSKSRPYQHRHHHQQYRGWATHHHNRRQQNHQQNSFYTRHQQQSPHYCYYYTEVERAMAEEDCGESYLLRVRPPLPADTTSILRSDSAAVMLPAKNMLPTSPLTSRATTTLSGCSSSPTERTLRGVVAGDYPDSDCAYLSSSGEGGSGFGAVWPLTSERSSPASCPTGTLLSAADTMTVGAQMDGTVGGLRKPTILTTEDVSFIVADAGAAAEDGAGMTATTAARATTEEESVAATSTTAPATTAATIETPTTTSSTDVRDGGVSAGFKEHGSSLNDALACGVSGSSGMSPGGSSAFKRIAWRTRYCCFGCSVKEATLVIAVVFIVSTHNNLFLFKQTLSHQSVPN